MKLGVNIDHIATLREARKEGFPSPVDAAKIVMNAGADGVVFHLREDRRHINDEDVYMIRKAVSRVDFEMATSPEIVKIALKVKPEMVTLVPEKRQEITTEGGLDVVKHFDIIAKTTEKLQKKGILVSLFVDPVEKQIAASAKTGAEFIELHTGDYSRNGKIKPIINSIKIAKESGLRINAGHGLGYNNVREITGISDIEELNIGFSIIARAVFVGLDTAVKEMIQLMV